MSENTSVDSTIELSIIDLENLVTLTKTFLSVFNLDEKNRESITSLYEKLSANLETVKNTDRPT